MLATLRDIRAQGNAAIYVRFRNAQAQYWDFQGSAWVASATAATRTFLTEYQDADTYESRYQVTVTVPSGALVAEYVKASDSSVLADEDLGMRTDVLGSAVAASQTAVTSAVSASQTAVTDAVSASQTAVTGAVSTSQTAVTTAISTSQVALDATLLRLRGLMLENTSQDQFMFDAGGRLTSARIRSYDTAAHATAAGTTGLLRTYRTTTTYDASGNITSFRWVEE